MAGFDPFAANTTLQNVSSAVLGGVPATGLGQAPPNFTAGLPDLSALTSPLASPAQSMSPGVGGGAPGAAPTGGGVGTPAGPWADQLLQMLHDPDTQANLQALAAWRRAEGGNASYNFFNTTQPESGASNYNSVGVKNYGSLQQGLQATVQTLENGDYKNILAALQSGNSAQAIGQAIANSPWGTGSLVLKVLGY